MPRVPILAVVPPVVFAGLAVLFFVGMHREDPEALPSTRIGQEAPPLSVVAFGDGPQTTDAVLRSGEVSLVNFWASWCAPCRAEHPQLEALATEGIPIHGLNFKDKPENAARFLAELGDPFATMAADPEGRTALDWGVYGVPETYVIDGAGNVVLRFAGPIMPATLAERIRPAIEAARTGG